MPHRVHEVRQEATIFGLEQWRLLEAVQAHHHPPRGRVDEVIRVTVRVPLLGQVLEKAPTRREEAHRAQRVARLLVSQTMLPRFRGHAATALFVEHTGDLLRGRFGRLLHGLLRRRRDGRAPRTSVQQREHDGRPFGQQTLERDNGLPCRRRSAGSEHDRAALSPERARHGVHEEGVAQGRRIRAGKVVGVERPKRRVVRDVPHQDQVPLPECIPCHRLGTQDARSHATTPMDGCLELRGEAGVGLIPRRHDVRERLTIPCKDRAFDNRLQFAAGQRRHHDGRVRCADADCGLAGRGKGEHAAVFRVPLVDRLVARAAGKCRCAPVDRVGPV